jgi:hypothetical protein
MANDANGLDSRMRQMRRYDAGSIGEKIFHFSEISVHGATGRKPFISLPKLEKQVGNRADTCGHGHHLN